MFELDIEAAMYLALNGVAKSGYVGEGGVVAIDQGEGMAGGDPGPAHDEALVKACAIE